MRLVVDRDVGVPVPLSHREVVGLGHHLNVRDQIGAGDWIIRLGSRYRNIKPVILIRDVIPRMLNRTVRGQYTRERSAELHADADTGFRRGQVDLAAVGDRGESAGSQCRVAVRNANNI